jgi:hypothetical protein
VKVGLIAEGEVHGVDVDSGNVMKKTKTGVSRRFRVPFILFDSRRRAIFGFGVVGVPSVMLLLLYHLEVNYLLFFQMYHHN